MGGTTERDALDGSSTSDGLFRNAADRIPAWIVLGANVATFSVYAFFDSVWVFIAFWALMSPLRGAIGAWSHHHQHCFTFRSTALNRLLEMGHATQTGMTTHLWVLHHVLGHHVNYLDQTKDESRWARRDGTKMGAFEYVLSVVFTAYWRALLVGLRHPRYLPAYIGGVLATSVLVGGLVWLRPVAGLLVFVLPMITALMWVAWATYDHHAGLPTDDPWKATYNIENRVYNLITCNLGYHTAHHHRPGVHWSNLPQLHEKVRHRIPPELLVRSTFDRWLPNKR